MGKFRRFLIWAKNQFFRLNKKQREHISKLCHILGTASTLPIIIRILGNEQHSDDWLAVVGVFYAILFEVLAICALATKEGDE